MCQNNIFNNINGYPLDEQQIKAATSKSKYSIIVAGAGSGKSTTMVGKVKYLINHMDVNPEQILCISFTNESSKSLKESIWKNCNIEIDVMTFHKLALNILKDNNISFSLISPDFLNYIINEYFLIANNQHAMNNSIIFLKNKFYSRDFSAYSKLLKSKEFACLKKLIVKFLNVYFSQFNSIDFLKKLYTKSKKGKDKAFFSLIIAIYRIYEIEKCSQSLIDFDDMIKIATNTIKNNGILKPYKYIIIDEFQDTSENRFNLIKSIIKRNDAHLTVVGDDFQSIYRFSGCNLNIFLNFTNTFPNSEISKIENTYRNSQELINIAGDFIMKNPLQIKKNLKSNKHINKPIKIINEKDYTLKKLLTYLNELHYNDVLILGRNNFDINKYLDKDFSIDENGIITSKNYQNLNIRFLTVHKSKGLEANIVIILNLVNEKFGFPNKIEDHKILNCLNNTDNYPFEEERRLFYVALTRTKNHVYLLTQKNNSSIFVKELLKYHKNHIEIIK